MCLGPCAAARPFASFPLPPYLRSFPRLPERRLKQAGARILSVTPTTWDESESFRNRRRATLAAGHARFLRWHALRYSKGRGEFTGTTRRRLGCDNPLGCYSTQASQAESASRRRSDIIPGNLHRIARPLTLDLLALRLM